MCFWQRGSFESVEDYEREARRKLAPIVRNYVFGSTESGATLARNTEAFSKYLIRRRVLQSINIVETGVSYFEGKMKSELPFFPKLHQSNSHVSERAS